MFWFWQEQKADLLLHEMRGSIPPSSCVTRPLSSPAEEVKQLPESWCETRLQLPKQQFRLSEASVWSPPYPVSSSISSAQTWLAGRAWAPSAVWERWATCAGGAYIIREPDSIICRPQRLVFCTAQEAADVQRRRIQRCHPADPTHRTSVLS